MIAAALALLLGAVAAAGQDAPAADAAGVASDEGRAAPAPATRAATELGVGGGAEGAGLQLLPRLHLEPPHRGGPFEGRVMLGAAGGALAGDAAVVALTVGAYQLFTSGAVSATASHFRTAGVGLLLAAVILPPLGAALGGGWAGRGVRSGGFWRAFLLSVLGQSLALTAGYLTAPTFWALVPVQLATLAPATSLGFHWGASARAAPPLPALPAPPGLASASGGLGAPGCPVGG